MTTYKIQQYPVVVAKQEDEVTATGAGAVGADAATLVTLSGFSIAAGHAVKIKFAVKKLAGGIVAAPAFGIKLNGIQCHSSTNGHIAFANDNIDKFGWFETDFIVPDANYPSNTNVSCDFSRFVFSSQSGSVTSQDDTPGNYIFYTAAIPNGPLTSIAITCDVKNAVIAVSIRNVVITDLG